MRIKEENQTTDLPVESVLIHNDYDKESISRVNDLALVKITGKNGINILVFFLTDL